MCTALVRVFQQSPTPDEGCTATIVIGGVPLYISECKSNLIHVTTVYSEWE